MNRQYLNGEIQMAKKIWKMFRTTMHKGNANKIHVYISPHFN